MSTLDRVIFQIKDLFIKYQSFIVFSMIVLSIPVLLSYVPYVNLVYTLDKGVLIYLLMVLIFIRPSMRLLLMFGITLLLSALILLLLGLAYLAEQVGNIIFLLLAIKIFSLIFAYFKKLKVEK